MKTSRNGFLNSPTLCQKAFDFETNFLHVEIYRISYGLWMPKMSFQTDALSSAYDWLDSHAPQYYWHRAPPIKHQLENMSDWVDEQRKL